MYHITHVDKKSTWKHKHSNSLTKAVELLKYTKGGILFGEQNSKSVRFLAKNYVGIGSHTKKINLQGCS